MALRDAVGFVNGLRRVAGALYAETTAEFQRTLTGSQPCRAVRESRAPWSEYGEMRWMRGGGRDSEYFPEWSGLEEGLPGLSRRDGESVANLSPAQQSTLVPGKAGQRPTEMDTSNGVFPPKPSLSPPLPPPWGQSPKGSGRSYHTHTRQLRPLPVWHNRHQVQWFHSSTRLGNETVVGGAGHVETTDKKPAKPKQKVNYMYTCTCTR